LWPDLERFFATRLMYILNRRGLRQLPWGRPVNVDRVLEEPNEEEKTRFLLLKRESNMLPNSGGAFKEIM